MKRWIFCAVIACIFPAGQASGSDMLPPDLTEFDFNPKTVNVTGASTSLTLIARITDATGFDYGLFVFRSPSSNQSAFAAMAPGNRISGSATNGQYRVSMTIEQYAETGTWTLAQISLRDTLANATNLHDSALSALCVARGFPQTFEVNSGATPDTDPPFMSRLTFTPMTVDVGDGAAVIAVTSRVEDVLSGVSYAEVRLTAPDHSESDLILFTTNQLVSGNANSGDYSALLTIPQMSPTGTWTVSHIKMVDRSANVHAVTGADAVAYCALMYLTNHITVESNPTRSPPVLSEFDYSPKMLYASNTPATIAVTMRVETVEGDFASGLVTFQPQSGAGTSVGLDFTYEDRISGNGSNGVYVKTFELPAHAAPSVWAVTGLELYDAGGGSLMIGGAAVLSYMVNGDFPYLITVLPDTPDTNEPVIVEQLINPSYVDVSAGDQDITVSTRLTDDLSGLDYARMKFSNPSSNQNITCIFSLWKRTSGDMNDGWYEDVLTIPQHAEPGQWILSGIELVDFAGNVLNLEGQAAVDYCMALAPNVAYVFDVASGTPDLLPPVIESLSLNPAVLVATNDSGSIAATAWVSDNLSGLYAGTIYFTSPSGSNSLQAELSGSTRISGGATGGVYGAVLGISTNTEKGYWSVSAVELADAAGNSMIAQGAAAQTYCDTHGMDKGFSIVEPFGVMDVGNSVVRWLSLSGVRYAFEYADSLPGPWSPIGGVYLGDGSLLSAADDFSAHSNRFYRLAILPPE